MKLTLSNKMSAVLRNEKIIIGQFWYDKFEDERIGGKGKHKVTFYQDGYVSGYIVVDEVENKNED